MYIQFNSKRPAGATPFPHIKMGMLNIYRTEDDELVGIELLGVSSFSDSIETLAAQFEPPVVDEDDLNDP